MSNLIGLTLQGLAVGTMLVGAMLAALGTLVLAITACHRAGEGTIK